MLLSGDLDSIFGQVLMMCETVANPNKEVQIQTVPPHALSSCVCLHIIACLGVSSVLCLNWDVWKVSDYLANTSAATAVRP